MREVRRACHPSLGTASPHGSQVRLPGHGREVPTDTRRVRGRGWPKVTQGAGEGVQRDRWGLPHQAPHVNEGESVNDQIRAECTRQGLDEDEGLMND